MKNLPLGVQDFKKLREEGLLYVDKTALLYEPVQKGGYYFLSRPRRFGKSLLISTLHELFEGNKSLFKGLWIEDKIDWQKHPVIRIDFSAISYKTQDFEIGVRNYLKLQAEKYELSLQNTDIKEMLGELITSLYTKYQAQVVLLVDEYDKPIIDFLEDLDKAREHRDFLKNMYSIIKPMDGYLRFVFLTGVSKFSKVSIFSDLNNLTDISTSKEFANITGYTQEELEHYFDDRIKEMSAYMNVEKTVLLQKIKTFYNGYSWNGKDFLYNPFSVLSFFRIKSFDNFWFSTGTPTFLTKLLQKDFVYDLKKMRGDKISLDNLNLEKPSLIALLFQTGYLTIKEHNTEDNIFYLDYPNTEVEESMLKFLLAEYIHQSISQPTNLVLDIRDALRDNDFELLKDCFNALFGSIPQDYFLANREKFYHAIIFLTFKLLGYFAQVETPAGRGRLDAVVSFKEKIFIFEFKRDQSAQAAIDQIHEKGYYLPYQGKQKDIYLLGINLISERKEIDDVLVEKM